MKRVLMLFGEAGCRVAQSVLYAACAGAWPGETQVLLIANEAQAALVEATSGLYSKYERVRLNMAQLEGDKLGFTAPLQLKTWPHRLPAGSLARWAAEEEDRLLLRAMFTKEAAEHDLNTRMEGRADAARVVFEGLMQQGEDPLPWLKDALTGTETVRILLGGNLADGWSAAGMKWLARHILAQAENGMDRLELGVMAMFPCAGTQEHAHDHAAAELAGLVHGGTVYILGMNESDCASCEEDKAQLTHWLAQSCADSFFRAEKPYPGLMTYRVAPGKLGWESFPTAYRLCFGSLIKTAAAFTLTFEPVIRRGLTAPKWLRDKMIGWYASYFRQAPKMDDDQRRDMLRDLEDVKDLLTGAREWISDILRNLPPLLRSASAVEQARQEAADNYRQYIETAGQLMVMLREAEASGLTQEKTVHRHDMEDNEAEKMQKLFQQIEVRKQALAARQEELNRRIGGAAQLLMMKTAIRRLRAESADLHAQAAEAARRIDEAARIASIEEQHAIATARTKLQRMERYMAQVDACWMLVEKERSQAKADQVRRRPPEMKLEAALPESGLFDPQALDKLYALPAMDESRPVKKLWAEAEAGWSSLVLPLSGQEATLQEFAGKLKTKEEYASPVTALVRDVMLMTAKEVR